MVGMTKDLTLRRICSYYAEYAPEEILRLVRESDLTAGVACGRVFQEIPPRQLQIPYTGMQDKRQMVSGGNLAGTVRFSELTSELQIRPLLSRFIFLRSSMQ